MTGGMVKNFHNTKRVKILTTPDFEKPIESFPACQVEHVPEKKLEQEVSTICGCV